MFVKGFMYNSTIIIIESCIPNTSNDISRDIGLTC